MIRPSRRTKATVIVGVSRKGALLAGRLHGLLEDSELYVPARFADDVPSATHLYEGRVAAVVDRVFPECEALIAVMSLGVTVRLIAPHLRDKHSDPAVVVVDDTGSFAISALSGHLGGANALAKQIGELIGARTVVTTASDLAGTIQVDLLGSSFGWDIDTWDDVTAVSAAVVNGEPVGVFQDAGEPDWWPQNESLPPNINVFPTLEALATAGLRGALIISDRRFDKPAILSAVPAVIYRPKTIVLGIGCNRWTTADEIEGAALGVLESHGLSLKSVRNIASIDVKADEQGLLQFAERYGFPLKFFSAAELSALGEPPSPSETVFASVGVKGVCEPAAMLSSGSNYLLVHKQKLGNVTVAIARVEFGKRSE